MATLMRLMVAFLLAVGCNGAPSRPSAARNGLANPYIIMGKDADIEQFPYQISIEILHVHSCGGAIISENYALTTARCIDSWTSWWLWMKRIRAGSTTSFPLFGWGGKIHFVADALQHPQWSKRTMDYDIAVVKVSNPFVYDFRVQPILVPPAGEGFLNLSRNATVSGWGVTRADRWLPLPSWRLHTVDVPLLPRLKCRDILSSSGAFNITSRMLCAAGTGLGGPCKGDSGGALVHRGKVIGLSSWEMKCNDASNPSVFTNVLDPEIREFIKQHTGV